MRVSIPSQLRSYTRESQVEARGATLGELLGALDTAYPGIRFRMIDEQERVREHIRFFVNGELLEDLRAPLNESDQLRIICAISGG